MVFTFKKIFNELQNDNIVYVKLILFEVKIKLRIPLKELTTASLFLFDRSKKIVFIPYRFFGMLRNGITDQKI